ncbi:MAG: HAMP domain-containing sensor histidine kinase [Solirubrobacteraceae bacterium]
MRSLRNRLAALFGLIVLGAIAIAYLLVVPPLEGQLRDQKVDGLEEAARLHVGPIRETVGADNPVATVQRRLETASARARARVTLLDVGSGTQGLQVSGGLDSEDDPGDESRFVLADRAARSGSVETGTEPTSLGRVAEVAVPLKVDGTVVKIAVFSDDLEAVDDNVAFIRSRILLGGIVAFGVAVLAGYVVARALTARVRRLERAARRVAEGDFSTRIRVDSDDELGRLAAAFDQMQVQLAQLQTAREQFIATASHELRTPLFSLGGFVELLADEELDEQTRREFTAQVRGQVERLTKLATELLDLSRLGSGAVVLRPEPTDLSTLAREVTAEFRPALGDHEVEVTAPSAGVEVECDPERVAQVLRILMDNALVHTPPGTAIRVSAERVDGEARLTVADTGLGIARKAMPRIFEPFFTASDDGSRGAGLGLAIASELAERMDGELTAASRPGGTTFTLVLPA